MKLPPELAVKCLELAGEKPAEANPRWSESQFQAAVVAMAKRQGWLCFHAHDSRRSEPGFPDLVLVRRSRLIFAELKSGSGRLTVEQAEWKQALERAGEVVYVWRPDDWRFGAVQEVLQAVTRPLDDPARSPT